MDIQSFIQSGLLEAYVLGQCSAEERTQVERMAADHVEVRAELSSIEASLEGYAAAHAVQPPDWMKTSILERLEQEPPGNSPPEELPPGPGKAPLRFFQILAFLLAVTCSFLFLRQKDMGHENNELRFRTDSLQQKLVACSQEVQKPDPIAELLCDPGTQRILVSDGKGIYTIIYYNASQKKIAYDPYSLPSPKPGSYYQFWAIVGDKPVSLGMQASNMCASIHTVENAIAFAISAEGTPEGNPAPTTVLAIGKAG
ncbi:MAG: anti-sigma factor [Saprospiraceae bacterium]|nr:anti-sigma factor [Saprospiraceae bacterium]